VKGKNISCQFEINGLKGEALKAVWTSAQPHHKQPIDSELVSVNDFSPLYLLNLDGYACS
jgi:hypothetical protein